MSWYIRKSLSLGPLRLNSSRSGLGASFGVKGARISVGPRGSYVHVGRGGLYYRQNLVPHPARPRTPSAPTPVPAETLHEIESGDIGHMVDVSSADLLTELNRVNGRISRFPLALVITLLLVAALIAAPILLEAQLPPSDKALETGRVPTAEVLRDRLYRQPQSLRASSSLWWSAGATTLAVLSIPLLIWARRRDVRDGKVTLKYDLEPDAEAAFSSLITAFTQFGESRGFWHITARGANQDWKRHAGADSVVNRRSVTPGVSLPRRVECNLAVPALPAGRQNLYFFPDRLLVYDSNGVGAVPYTDLDASSSQVRFREDSGVPSDGEVIGNTWLYVNRNGGPDRRFRNNREILIVLYGQLSLESASGLKEVFQASKPTTVDGLVAALEQLRRQP
jgi:Protein of unknown function (DUF4236)